MQCPATVLLNLSENWIVTDKVTDGSGRIAGVLGQCPSLTHLDIGCNQFGPTGAESFAGVLAKCTTLVHLDLEYNRIGPDGAESLV